MSHFFGPWGAVVGSMVGQGIDRDLFGQVRHGPRLGDLTVQTSRYGAQLPRVYGTMRVAGTVIWATDLQEVGTVEGGGKSSPDTVSYAYSASFAVALSSRPAVRIRRIWADGKLLRGAAGDFKVRTGFRFYPGSEDQRIDPLIASIETAAKTPAFRGTAVAVFDQLQLAGYGNRIPVITFELVADEADTSVESILGDISGKLPGSNDEPTIQGYAAHGASILDAMDPLMRASGLQLDASGMAFGHHAGEGVVKIGVDLLGCSVDGEGRTSPVERRRASAADLPASLSMTYYDLSRDYQAGEQHATIAPEAGRQDRVDLPAVVPPETAKQMVQELLTTSWRERETVILRLPVSFLHLKPGNLLALGPDEELWQVRRVGLERFVVTVECRRAPLTSPTLQPSDPGRALPEADVVAGPTILKLLQLPGTDPSSDELLVSLAAAGGATPWRSAPVTIEVGGRTFTTATARRRTIIGQVDGALGPGSANVIDHLGSVVVRLHHQDDWLTSCSDDDLAAGENLASIGSELLQFGRAEALGDGRFRLSRLVRGRRATEWAIAEHASGETFCLIDQAALVSVPLSPAFLGAEVTASAHGVADNADSGTARTVVTGESLRPPSPVRLTACMNDLGELTVAWLRRSWRDFAWVDAPEEQDMSGVRCEVRLVGTEGSLTTLSAYNSHRFAADEMDQLGAGPITITITMRELGNLVSSHPGELTFDPACNQEQPS